MTRTNSRTSKKNKCQNTAITLKLQLRANNDKGGTSSFWENGQSERQSWRRKTVRCARKHNSQLQRREEKRHKEIRPRPAGRERRRAGSDPCWRMPGSNLCVVKVVESSRFTLQLFKAATHGAPAIMRCVCMCVCMCVCVCALNRFATGATQASTINDRIRKLSCLDFEAWLSIFLFLEMIHEVVKHINCCNSYLPTERQDRFFLGRCYGMYATHGYQLIRSLWSRVGLEGFVLSGLMEPTFLRTRYMSKCYVLNFRFHAVTVLTVWSGLGISQMRLE